MAVQIQRVEALLTFPLRQRVLRPHETLDQLVLPGDDDRETAHFVAIDDGEVIGTASVRREAPPWSADATTSWRLRRMATTEERRNEGIGAALLAQVVDHVRGHGGGLLWCNARTPALSFYLRAEFTTHGEGWVDPIIGPHIAMQRIVEAPSASSQEPSAPEDADHRQG